MPSVINIAILVESMGPSRMLKKGDGVAGTIPLLAQRAASEGWAGSGQVPSPKER